MVWALWGWVWLGVGLLSGILALLRELRGLYGQQEDETRKKRLLNGYARVAKLADALDLGSSG